MPSSISCRKCRKTTPDGSSSRTLPLRSPIYASAEGGSCELDLYGRLLLRRRQFVARRGGRPRARGRGRLLRHARRAQRPARADPARREIAGADPRAAGRRRRPHHRRATTPRFDARPDGGRRRARGRAPTAARRTASSTASRHEHQAASDDAWARVERFIDGALARQAAHQQRRRWFSPSCSASH